MADEDARRRLRAALEVDLVPEQTSDDSDDGWGERPRTTPSPGTDRDVQHYLDEKPPHH